MSIATDKLKQYMLKQKAKGVTQGDIAKSIGCSRSYLSEIVNGVKIPSIRIAARINKIVRSIKLDDWYEQNA